MVLAKCNKRVPQMMTWLHSGGQRSSRPKYVLAKASTSTLGSSSSWLKFRARTCLAIFSLHLNFLTFWVLASPAGGRVISAVWSQLEGQWVIFVVGLCVCFGFCSELCHCSPVVGYGIWPVKCLFQLATKILVRRSQPNLDWIYSTLK